MSSKAKASNSPRAIRTERRNRVSLEERQRLSRSILWKLQRNYFNRRGIEAWRTGAVPHHITSSPFMADAYARIIAGFLRDSSNVEVETPDRNRPVYVVECGSGPGRFAYLLLQKLLGVREQFAARNIPIKYVMTDFTLRTLEYWHGHPWFQPLVEQGILDFACFDVERDQELSLLHSGETIAAGCLQNPLVVIANYLFDSIPQDAFLVSGGQLFETLISLRTPQKEEDASDPEILSRVELSYDYNRVNGNYYADAAWNRILLDYKHRLKETPFLFPKAALQCIQNLHRLSRGQMLLLSGDLGYSGDQALLEGKGAPTMAVHGSISMMVDYQIIGEYCQSLGGEILHPGRRSESLNVSAFVFGDSPAKLAETRAAYTEAIQKFGPDDFFTLKEGIDQVYDALTLDQILAFLRLSCWDYKRFWECLPVLKKHLPHLTRIQKHELREAIVNVWDSYLPIGEDNDLAFELGTLLVEIDCYEEARRLLQHSVDLYGMAPGTAYNLGVCCYSLGEMQQALGYLNKALELDPELAEAKTLRTELAPVSLSQKDRQRRQRRA